MAETTGLAAEYGISEALFADPIYGNEIKAIFDLINAKNEAGARELLFKSKYFTDLSSTVRARRKEQMEQLPVYQDNLQKFTLATRKRLATLGVKIDETTLNNIIKSGYDNGLSNDQIDAAVSASGKVTGFGGSIIGDTTALKAYAEQFGVSSLLNADYWSTKQQELFTGTTTTEDIQKNIMELSAGAYPAYAEGIMNGTPVKSQLSNVLQSVSTLLERQADLNDPMVKQIAQWVDPATGKPGKMPQWMVEKTVKSSPQWAFTDNGRDTIDNLSLKVLRDMGVM